MDCDCIAHICGLVTALCLIISGIVCFTYGGASGVVFGILDIICGLIVCGLEAPEVVGPMSFLSFLDPCLNFFKPPLFRFILYVVLCFTFGGYPIGFLCGICVIIMAVYYGIKAFCPTAIGGSQSNAQTV